MARKSPDSEAVPQVELRQESVARQGEIGYWSVAWVVENKGLNSLEILGVRLPHGQFKADEQCFDPPLNLAPGECGRFRVSVRCHEPPGLVTENAFVIFSVTWSGRSWRIFARIRVIVEADGTPQAQTELITRQIVGFSGVVS
jgi:hypothetical protein